MFIYSVKTSKTKIAVISLVIIAAAAAILSITFGKRMPAATDDSYISVKAENAEQRNAFISQFGWKFSADPIEVSEVIIPHEFDDVYIQYNEMNKSQGMDLEPYKGLRAKHWTYDILNYPGYEGQAGVIQLNMLVYNGQVIGGDVCSMEKDGFIHGFEFPENALTTTVPQTTA